MRLKPEKIQQLARRIVADLESNPEVAIEEERGKVIGLVERIIREDMEAEEEIKEQAHKMLEAYKTEIDRKGASYDKLFRKAVEKIAQERKMVL